MATEMAHTVVKLTDGTRDLLKRMNFIDIPEGVNYIAFFEDGEAAFVEELETVGFALPKMGIISYYDTSTEVVFD